MNTRIKIIKRNRNAEDRSQVNPVVDSSATESGNNKRRDMVNTVKSWIAELNERKRMQPHSFSPLPVVATTNVVRCSYD